MQYLAPVGVGIQQGLGVQQAPYLPAPALLQLYGLEQVCVTVGEGRVHYYQVVVLAALKCEEIVVDDMDLLVLLELMLQCRA